ncbi:PDZ domain-containing protein [Phytoactinopolyspora sp. XMNu-373]|uniref:PDZ domain-containing protein n=2 Tax=Phytoactinopolyspora mesophila TaxID=2650750 RepID=A0A7K3LZ69_9ACTN|nr:PDZ domain-containing protein [Phytoactinopolyspora mesophila]
MLAAPVASAGDQKPKRGRMLVTGLVIGAIIGGGSGAAVTAWLDDSPEESPGQSSLVTSDDNGERQPAVSLDSVESVAEQILPSVVSITIGNEFGGQGGTGSGVVISSDGEILTNAHVAEAAGPGGQLRVTFEDGTVADAEVVGSDPLIDLAVIRAQDVSGLTPATLGNSGDLLVGEQVVAIGSPLGLDGTVTSGIVSALQRPVAIGEERDATTVIDAIQTDAPINRGNSGGPLVNMAGEVIGINSAIATSGMDSGSIGLGFSIPIDQARPIAEELIETGSATHARIGVEVGTPQGDTPGALVGRIEPGGSAADAGLEEGDIITRINDRVVQDHISLIAAVRSYRPGDEVTLTFIRDGDEQTVDLVLGSDAQIT